MGLPPVTSPSPKIALQPLLVTVAGNRYPLGFFSQSGQHDIAQHLEDGLSFDFDKAKGAYRDD
jgi:hypothetical protein